MYGKRESPWNTPQDIEEEEEDYYPQDGVMTVVPAERLKQRDLKIKKVLRLNFRREVISKQSIRN